MFLKNSTDWAPVGEGLETKIEKNSEGNVREPFRLLVRLIAWGEKICVEVNRGTKRHLEYHEIGPLEGWAKEEYKRGNIIPI